jgi:ADP-ribose pyrophosphatase YjhB (NUDIX family)
MAMNPERASLLATLLREMRKQNGDYIPEEAWLEVHQTFSLPYIELVIPRWANGKWEVFLTRRPHDDSYWPSMWHLPGGIWRTTKSQTMACQSIASRELGTRVTNIKEVMTHKWKTHPYGRPISHVCVCRPKGRLRRAADRGYFERLPKPFIREQIEFVEKCIHYLRENSAETQ